MQSKGIKVGLILFMAVLFLSAITPSITLAQRPSTTSGNNLISPNSVPGDGGSWIYQWVLVTDIYYGVYGLPWLDNRLCPPGTF